MKANKPFLNKEEEDEKINRNLENFKESKKIDSTEIMFIHEDRIIRINLETLSKSEAPLSIPEKISPFIAMCRLPNNEVFCFGNGSGLTFIFNSQGKFRQLPYGRPYYDSGCVYYNDNIYTFGGTLGYRIMKTAYKFDLSRNQWSRLANMPDQSMLCSCAVLQHKIIVSCHDSSCVYDPYIDSYTSLSHNSEIDGPVVHAVRNRGYIIDLRGNIYESYVDNPYTWFYGGKVDLLESSPFGYFGSCNDACYFLLRDYYFYKFDIKSCHISKVSVFVE